MDPYTDAAFTRPHTIVSIFLSKGEFDRGIVSTFLLRKGPLVCIYIHRGTPHMGSCVCNADSANTHKYIRSLCQLDVTTSQTRVQREPRTINPWLGSMSRETLHFCISALPLHSWPVIWLQLHQLVAVGSFVLSFSTDLFATMSLCNGCMKASLTKFGCNNSSQKLLQQGVVVQGGGTVLICKDLLVAEKHDIATTSSIINLYNLYNSCAGSLNMKSIKHSR